MNKSDELGKESAVRQAAGLPEQEKKWQAPRLTVWEVARDTRMGFTVSTKTGSGPDSHGMRDVTPPDS